MKGEIQVVAALRADAPKRNTLAYQKEHCPGFYSNTGAGSNISGSSHRRELTNGLPSAFSLHLDNPMEIIRLWSEHQVKTEISHFFSKILNFVHACCFNTPHGHDAPGGKQKHRDQGKRQLAASSTNPEAFCSRLITIRIRDFNGIEADDQIRNEVDATCAKHLTTSA